MTTIESITQQIQSFRDARNWKQFHKPKDMALSLILEASELLEHFQWKSEEEAERHLKDSSAEIGRELADVLYWTVLMAADFGIDLAGAFRNKMVENAAKYPVEAARGSAKKYSELASE